MHVYFRARTTLVDRALKSVCTIPAFPTSLWVLGFTHILHGSAGRVGRGNIRPYRDQTRPMAGALGARAARSGFDTAANYSSLLNRRSLDLWVMLSPLG